MAVNQARRARSERVGRQTVQQQQSQEAPVAVPKSTFQRALFVWFGIVGVVSLLALNEYQKLGFQTQEIKVPSGIEISAAPVEDILEQRSQKDALAYLRSTTDLASDEDSTGDVESEKDEPSEIELPTGISSSANLRASASEETNEDDETEDASKGEKVSGDQTEEAEREPEDAPETKTHESRKKVENRVDEEDDEEFDIPFDIRPVHRNGCPFGWHSPSLTSPNCYHVSLVTLPADEANGRCAELGSIFGMRAYLVRVPTTEVNMLLCDVLNRGNNRFLSPDRLHIGLTRGSDASLQWRDGTKFETEEEDMAAFVTSSKSLTSSKTTTLVCSGKNYLKWNVESDSSLPFACSGPKIKTRLNDGTETEDRRELDEDSFSLERSSLETMTWAPVAPWERHTVASCEKVAQEEEEFGMQKRAHKNPMLAGLDTQINWKLTEKKGKLEPKRHYMVWQSKAWFGWLDFWVEYLVKYRDFSGAPIGKYVTSSRAAKQRLGYSSIFANPATAQKYEGALVVLSRLPIPENVLAYFPPGALVNQIYYDPVARVPLGDKLELAQQLIRYSQQLGCNQVADLDIIPQTFDLSDANGCSAAMKWMTEKESEQNEVGWIIKGPKHGGSAITLATPHQVLTHVKGCDSTVLDRHEIVQRLVKNPLLLDGRKFDLRVFVLVASTKPLIVYVHREPYYRATIRKFSAAAGGSSAAEKSRHVTNTHIQKVARSNFTERDWADHIWTPDRVKLYAIKANVRPDFWSEVVFPKIKRAVQAVVKATASSLKERRQGQWKLFGVDFVIDDTLNPLLLDWNAFPGWDWSYRLTWTLEYRRRILTDTWKLMLDIQRGKAISESRDTPISGGYELVFHSLK